MNRIIITILCMLAFSSCVKSKLEVTYNSQESKIESYIASKGDTYRSTRNGGANRLVLKEGEGEELQRNGFVSFYYAGYIFKGSNVSASNLFATNHQPTAESSNFATTDPDYSLFEANIADNEMIEGLRNGLIGVQAGEECEILFTAKYGYGNKTFGIIPVNSALLYKIWVEGVSNE
jgi:FKBP-type peptidyl-prolyl cis-trans isomerase